MPLGAILGGISAATSIIGGISAGQSAADANAQQKKLQKKLKKTIKEGVRRENNLEAEMWNATKDDYLKQSNYQSETVMQNWLYAQGMRNIENSRNMGAYIADQQRVQQQYEYNALGERMASQGIQRSLDEIRVGNAFNLQNALVTNLQAQGKAQLGQAGQSSQRIVNATLADLGRDIAVMDASMKAAIDETNVDLLNLHIQRQSADQTNRLSAMLEPIQMPDIPMPQLPPMPSFIEAEYRDPDKIAQRAANMGVEQSTTAPVVGGVLDGLGGLLGFIK